MLKFTNRPDSLLGRIEIASVPSATLTEPKTFQVWSTYTHEFKDFFDFFPHLESADAISILPSARLKKIPLFASF